MEQPGRLRSLDGLRGVAAGVVLLHHSLLLIPAMVVPYVTPPSQVFPGWTWLAAYTPLHLVWDGSVAVMLFFVLSGFVLVLPYARRRGPGWAVYYPRRMVRLYVPVAASVVLASMWLLVVPFADDADVSPWMAGHANSFDLGAVWRDVVLVFYRPGYTNSALWSLRWEVFFSLLLPVFVAAAATWRRGAWVKLGALSVLMFAGAQVGADATYRLDWRFQLPAFAVGAVMAFEWGSIRSTVESWRPQVRTAAWALVVLGLSSYWLVYALGAPPARDVVVPAARVVQVLAAGGLIALTGARGSWSAALSSGRVQWLGTRSFSLYLVHEPIVAAAGNVAGVTGAPEWVGTIAAIVVALVVAEVFFRTVERPSHRLARAIGRRPIAVPA